MAQKFARFAHRLEAGEQEESVAFGRFNHRHGGVDNGVGIAGVGYNAKLLFTKHFADNQSPGGSNYSSSTYEGVLYAATHGAKIINCSWGSYVRSAIAQDIITFVTLDLGCLVVAAGGNSNLEVPIYPAAYEHVLAIANTNSNDERAPFSNYGQYIDLTAPGVSILTTTFDDDYGTDSGTSLSAPQVSGAAALVWTLHPEWTPQQVAEQLRVSADETIYLSNPDYLYKLGKGRLDVAQALALASPSVRAGKQDFLTDEGAMPQPGDAARLIFDFTNYLQPTTALLTVTLSSTSPHVTITQNMATLGVIAEGATVRNDDSPFELLLSSTLPVDVDVPLLLTFSDEDYNDFQLVSIVIPTYFDIDENNILTSLTSSGRIGFGDVDAQRGGSGFVYDEENLLFEMGLIMGTAETMIFSNVRGAIGVVDNDFTATNGFTEFVPGERSYAEVKAGLRNDPDPQLASLVIGYQSLVWNHDPYRDFVILEYKISNTTDQPVSDFYFGLFADWDIGALGAADHATWDDDSHLGYVIPLQGSALPRAGIQALSGSEQYFAIDNDPTIPGNPFGLYDGFTDGEKFASISSGLSKTTAGDPSTGGDVSHVVASGPFTIDPGGMITVAFAIHAAKTTTDIINSAKHADTLYNMTLKAPIPVAGPVAICDGAVASITATGASAYNWYTSFTGGEPIASGDVFDIPSLTGDTVFYVSNADNSFESVRAEAAVSVVANPVIQASGSVIFCAGGSVVLAADDADTYTWSSGEDTQEITVTNSGEYTVTVARQGINCVSPTPVVVQVEPSPAISFTTLPENPSPMESVTFVTTSQDATSWFWDFGDGNFSFEENPVHTYATEGEFTAIVSVVGDNGCPSSASKTFGVITGLEEHPDYQFSVYPNPVVDNQLRIAVPYGQVFDIRVIDLQGRQLYQSTFSSAITIRTDHLDSGEYIISLSSGEQSIARRIVVKH